MGKIKNAVTLDNGAIPKSLAHRQALLRQHYDELMHKQASIASTASAVKDLSVAATTAVIRSPVVSAATTIRGARNIVNGFKDFGKAVIQEIDRQERDAK